MKRNVSPATMIAIVILIVALVALGPLVVIWALNTIFGLSIAYTFWTWLAMIVLMGVFGKNNVNVSKND